MTILLTYGKGLHMPSTSAAQHRWIGYLHSNPGARKASGMSKAKVDEWLHADRGSPWKHAGGGIVQRYDDGGSIDPNAGTGIGGPAPTQGGNPMTQSMIQRYSAYPTEKLAELAAQMGGTSQGQLIQKLLMQRRLSPPPDQQQGQGIVAPATQAYARGGTVKRDIGGGVSMSDAMPYWARHEATAGAGNSGFLNGATAGRADQVKTQAPPGAYVIPADVIAGLGEGNSLSGARVMQGLLDSGPYGTRLPRAGGRNTIPRPPHLPSNLKSGGTIPIFNPKERANGGANTGETPVDLSDGEFLIHPADVDRFGNGDRSRGHAFFDKWVVRKRKEHISKLKSLPGPVKPRAA